MDDLQKQSYDISTERQEALQAQYQPFMAETQAALNDAQAIVVADATDIQGMNKARTTRLQLKKIRIELDKKRKELKEQSLREGRAIDGYANIVKAYIVPAEKRLQGLEDAAKNAEAERIEALIEKRTSELKQFQVDCRFFDLGLMDEAAFQQLKQSSEIGYNARIEAEKAAADKAEAERIASEKAESKRLAAERAERERVRAENERLQKEAEQSRNAAAAAKKKQEEAEEEQQRLKQAEADAKAEAERVESKRKIAAEKLKAERRRARDLKAQIDSMNVAATCPKCGHMFDAKPKGA